MRNELIKITEKAIKNHIWEFLGTNDIFAINYNQQRYYIYCANTEIPLSIRILKGEEGLKGLASLFDMDEEEKNDLISFEDFMNLECFELNLFLEVDMDDNTKEEIIAQGFSIDEKTYNPLFSVAEKNILRRNLNEEETKLFIEILNTLIKAKNYFSEFGKTSATSSFQNWFDSLNLKDSDKVDYIPLAEVTKEKTIFVAKKFDWFSLSPSKKEIPLIDVPQPLVEEVKKTKRNIGQILNFEIFLLTAPFIQEENSVPKYPYAFLLLDKNSKEIIDLQLDFNLEIKQKVYPMVILDLFAKNGKPEAIHTFSDRSFDYLSGILKTTNIKIIKKKIDEEFLSLALNIPELIKNNNKSNTKQDCCSNDCNCDSSCDCHNN